MAFPKHITLACVLLALTGLLVGCSEDGTVAPTLTSEAPMLAPVNVRISAGGNGTIVLEWDANTQPQLRGYNVYRLDREDYTISRLNGTELTTTSYVDGTTEWGHRYDYRVTAISAKGSESAYSVASIAFEQGPVHKKGRDSN